MERYQLSQDFADKQLQVLQKKYGGPRLAGDAALTIQRAFRRYSMAKKFADLTAGKRISRRLNNNEENTTADIVDKGQQQPQHQQQQKHHYRHHHPHHHHHQCHALRRYQQQQQQQQSQQQQQPPHNPESVILQEDPLLSGVDHAIGENNSPRIVSSHHHQGGHVGQVGRSQSQKSLPNESSSSSSSSTKKKISDTVVRASSARMTSGRKYSSPVLHHVQSSPSVTNVTVPAPGEVNPAVVNPPQVVAYTANEVIRKRHYRTGLNIFNKRPDKGVAYLIRRGFLENSPQAVARFLITRKGLSKQMIGEYLGSIQHPFNSAALNCFALEMDFSGMQLDAALRKFQTFFRMPGEAQKIERLMEVFSGRYCQCNPDLVAKFHSTDTTFILAFAIILLNTDLHTPSLKADKRMKVEDFVRNLRGIDDGHDVDPELLYGIYERIRAQEFRPGSDHVTQVVKVQQTIVSKCPNLAVPHRRLVCYCRLYEVHDPHKKERPGIHQREVFLFNDILVITKIHSRKKGSVTYAFRQSHLLAGMTVSLFETQFYPFGIRIAQKWDRKTILVLNARNEHDRSKFVEDLRESVAEMDEMEALRLESELEKQQRITLSDEQEHHHHHHHHRDSGIADSSFKSSPSTNSATNSSGSRHHHHHHHGHGPSRRTPSAPSSGSGRHLHPHQHHATQQQQAHSNSKHNHSAGGAVGGTSASGGDSNGVVLRRSAINNSLLDLSDATAEKMTRRGSVGSLDSGMSVSFQSTSVGSFNNNGAAAAAVNRSNVNNNHQHT